MAMVVGDIVMLVMIVGDEVWWWRRQLAIEMVLDDEL